MLITLEGTDGTGKSSAAKMLSDSLGFKFASTPGPEYMPLRKFAATNKYSAYHYYLSSCYYVSDMAGKIDIVCDRYIHSTLAYNWPFDREIPDDIFGYFEGLRKPDKSFLLCASDDTRRKRMSDRKSKGGIISVLDCDFDGQEKARKVYTKLPDLIHIDTDGMTLAETVKFLLNSCRRECRP